MEVSRLENLPPPPGVIESIKAGFDAVASRIAAILLPLLLNLFLWLGPRLRMEALFASSKNDMVSFWTALQIPAEDIQRMLTDYDKLSQSANLFAFIRTLPVGISSLFAGISEPFTTPIGSPEALQVTALNFPLWLLVLTLAGWVGGAIYFRSVAWAALAEKMTTPSILRAIVQTFLVSIAFNFILMVIGIPVLLVILIAAQISIALANLLVLFIALGSVFFIVPMFFWVHGIFSKRENVFTSMMSSIQLTRFTLPTSSLFVLTVFLLSYGLNFLWRIPKFDSWVTVLGIFGHSFVTTALLAASFIYYHNMNIWVQLVLERMRPVNTIKQA